MKRALLCLAMFFSVCATASSGVQVNENALLLRDALKDQKLMQQERQREKALKSLNTILKFQSVTLQTCQEKCEAVCNNGGGGGAGSSSCWQKCTNEGYGSSTCSTRC